MHVGAKYLRLLHTDVSPKSKKKKKLHRLGPVGGYEFSAVGPLQSRGGGSETVGITLLPCARLSSARTFEASQV